MALAGWISGYAFTDKNISVQWTDKGRKAMADFRDLLQELVGQVPMNGDELTALFAILEKTPPDADSTAGDFPRLFD